MPKDRLRAIYEITRGRSKCFPGDAVGGSSTGCGSPQPQRILKSGAYKLEAIYIDDGGDAMQADEAIEEGR